MDAKNIVLNTKAKQNPQGTTASVRQKITSNKIPKSEYVKKTFADRFKTK